MEKNNLGKICIAPFDVVLSSLDVVQPDLIFISKARSKLITDKNLQGAPDLVIEILSEDKKKDQIIKRKLYARYGIKEYWIVDPEVENIEIMKLKKEGYQTTSLRTLPEILTSPTFPGLSLSLSEIFPSS